MVTLLSERDLVKRSLEGGLIVQMELEFPTIFTCNTVFLPL